MATVTEENMLGVREVVAVGLFLAGLFFLMSLLTFNPDDSGWSQSGASSAFQNAGGIMGAWLSDLAFSVFGFESYLFPVLIAWYGYFFYQQGISKSSKWSIFFHWLGLIITLIAGTVIFYLHVPRFIVELPNGSGGILGQEAGDALLLLLNETNATLLSVSIFVLGLSFLMGFSWLNVIDAIGKYTLLSFNIVNRVLFVGQPVAVGVAIEAATKKKR